MTADGLLSLETSVEEQETHEKGVYSLALHGTPRYAKDFQHFAYANPDAPKGGTLRLAAVGHFDSFNPFILKGVPADGLDYLFETLMVPSYDEPYAQYGLLARSVFIEEDFSAVTYTLHEKAYFHDGHPVDAEDVVFSFYRLVEQGHPFYRLYFKDVADVQAVGSHQVRFTFKTRRNRELPLIIGTGLKILPKHWWEVRDFTKTILEPPLGSGPYHLAQFESGRHITYVRNPSYWGKDVPVNRGRYNFERIEFDYYRDATVSREAFKAGDYDFRLENQAKAWASDYDFPAVKEGRVIKEEIPHRMVSGMQGFVFNTRKALFKDPLVREALNYAYDFQWANSVLFHNAYTRSTSYFNNSELAASGLPSKEERALLEPFRDDLPERLFLEAYAPPSAGDKGIRHGLRQARRLLEQAGWVLKDTVLTHQETQQSFQFEILLRNPQFERVVAPYQRVLEKLGIQTALRLVQDDSHYQKRLETFDYDMIVGVFPVSLSPGNEQADYWSSQAAQTEGSRNYAGAHHPAIDALITHIIEAKTREQLESACRALDRVLLWHHYVIPHWHIQTFRIAWWDLFERPAILPPYNFSLDFWWHKSHETTDNAMPSPSNAQPRTPYHHDRKHYQ